MDSSKGKLIVRILSENSYWRSRVVDLRLVGRPTSVAHLATNRWKPVPTTVSSGTRTPTTECSGAHKAPPPS